MPSNYFSHNPNDLRNNYDEDDYSVTNYRPNANNYQNKYIEFTIKRFIL